jgi:hypothetical protein
MHPLPILFDYRTRKFEPTRRSFDFIEVTAPSVRRNDRVSLRICNAKATLRMRLCIARRSHLHRAKFIPQLSVDRRKIVSQNPAMMPVLF